MFISVLQSGDKFHCGTTTLNGGANPEGPFSVLLVLLASCSWIHRIDHVRFLATTESKLSSFLKSVVNEVVFKVVFSD